MNINKQRYEAYMQFLMKVLQATDESEGNPQVVYPLLQNNLEYLNKDFAEILRQWATWAINVRTTVETDEAQFRATVIGQFSDLIQQFHLGDKATNIEIAIVGYEAVLTVFTRNAHPRNWATTQIGLGNAYCNRIHKDKAQNLELAIAAFTSALEVFTHNAYPQEWAKTQMNLGSAYFYRIGGDRIKNLELAIAASRAALQVFTRDDAYPQNWAQTQSNLGTAYLYRIRGDKAQNIEDAIAAFTAAWEVFARNEYRYQRAKTQVNLGIAYSDRIRGDKIQNLELAIAAFTDALKVYQTHDAFPEDWAKTQMNLGKAYLYRTYGDKAENLELAIAASTAALQVYTPDAFPQEWATTQNNLGIAYFHKIEKEDKDKAENIELAIAAFTAASEIRTRDASPQQWAMTQNNLGNAYRHRIRGDKAQNFEQAIATYTPILEVYTRDTFPENHAQTLFNLGLVYLDAQQFNLAYQNLKSAIETVELLREEVISGSETKRKQAEQWNRLYHCMVKTCLELNNIVEAIEYVERSKTRNLVELILNRDSKTIFPPDVANQLEQLRHEIGVGQDNIQNSEAENPEALGQHLQQLRQQRNQLQDKKLPVGYGFNLEHFQGNLDKQTAIIEWYITSFGWETFIITHDNIQRLNICVQNDRLRVLLGYFQEYITEYFQNRDAWKNSLNSRLTHFAKILQIEDILKLIPTACSRLVLIPHVFLHLFPLHTLPLTEGQLLFEKFSNGVSYAPSCQLLQQIQQRKRPNFESIFAIQNPTKDLAYADLEVEQILPLFSSSEVLSKSQATKAELYQAAPNLKEVNYLHFACHGYFNLISPTNSCLLLADAYVSSVPVGADSEKYLKSSNGRNVDLSKCLTLGNLFDGVFDLNQCRLVILSACETGLIDFNNMSDEYIGLPSGFLYAGSSCVVSSLWVVDDSSTAYLMMKFLQNLREAFTSGQDVSVAVALNQAQKWLRDITNEDLEKWKSLLPPDIAKTKTREARIISSQSENFDPNKPYASPFYWAAFTAIGK
ncbi:CHAT domain-containing protein [Nostoc sp. UIC 10890]